MQQDVKKIIYYGALFNSTRMLVGAYAAIYLLNNGLSIIDIGLLKTFQAIVIMLIDIPTAYVSDRYSRKLSVFLGSLLGGAWLLMTGLSETREMFFVAEFFNAVSLALINGAFISYLVDTAKQSDTASHKVIGLFNSYKFFGMAVFSVLGTVLSDFSSQRDIWLAAGVMCLVISMVGLFLPKDVQHKAESNASPLKELRSISQKLFHNRIALQGILILLVTSVYYQVLIQYWQPFAKESLEYITHNTYAFGILFSAILMAQSGAGKVCKSIDSPSHLTTLGIVVGFASILMVALSQAYPPLLLLSIVLMFGCINILTSTSMGMVHDFLESSYRATADSIISTVLRVILMIVMPTIGYLQSIYGWFVLPCFMVFVLLAGLLIQRKSQA